jgi:cadmium resistance protein CadD (predicted permease)
MNNSKSLNINKKFYKKLGFWVGLSLLYETFGLFHHDQLFSITGLLDIICLVLGLGAIYTALTEKDEKQVNTNQNV